jgi:hypothetical protein
MNMSVTSEEVFLSLCTDSQQQQQNEEFDAYFGLN